MSAETKDSGTLSLIMKIVVGALSLVLIVSVGVFGVILMWAMRSQHEPTEVVAATGSSSAATAPAVANAPMDAPPADAAPTDDAASTDVVPAAFLELGQTTYALCAACHAPDGKGMPGNLAPALAGSEVVSGPTEPLALILLNGIQKTDMKYNGVMTPWKAVMSDEQIASVLTYIRANFGNDASPILTEQLAWAREKYGAEATSPTRDQLAAMDSDLPPVEEISGGE